MTTFSIPKLYDFASRTLRGLATGFCAFTPEPAGVLWWLRLRPPPPLRLCLKWLPDSSERESRLSVDCPFLSRCGVIIGDGRFSGEDSSAAENFSGGEVSLVVLMLPVSREFTAKGIYFR